MKILCQRANCEYTLVLWQGAGCENIGEYWMKVLRKG